MRRCRFVLPRQNYSSEWRSQIFSLLTKWRPNFIVIDSKPTFFFSEILWKSNDFHGRIQNSSKYQRWSTQSSRGVHRIRCSVNIQQIYRRTSIPKCVSTKLQSNFIGITFQHGCSPENLLYLTWAHFPKNGSGRLLLILGAYGSLGYASKNRFPLSALSKYTKQKMCQFFIVPLVKFCA